MENKTSKYFKYAIGEIILVVIGILIALQINNWNSNRLDNARIKTALNAIKADISKDTSRLNDFNKNANIELDFVRKIEERTLSKNATLDTLVKIAKYEFSYYWLGHFEYTNDTYESIKSSGFIEKIPDSLKVVLIDFYDSQNYWVKVLSMLNMQYRDRFDEFSRTYSPDIVVIGAKRKYSYINNINWQGVDPKHFNPRFYALIGAKNILWSSYIQELILMQKKSDEVLKQINMYLDD